MFNRKVAIAKIEPERRIVYGWAYVTKNAAGMDVVDYSGEFTTTEEIERAAERFMEDSRIGGAFHKHRAGYAVHSIVVTDDVADALNIVSKQRGWFIGMRIEDDEAWEKVKSGEYAAFSIGGSADMEVIDG